MCHDLCHRPSSPSIPDRGYLETVIVSDWPDDLINNPESPGPDKIALGDKNRNSQIGGLGAKVERLLATSATFSGAAASSNEWQVPIFEFRSLESLLWSDLTGQISYVGKS